MKRFLSLLVAAIALSQCSPEPEIIPLTPEEDMRTSAALYADQFLTMSVTTEISDPDVRLPDPVYFFLDGTGGEVTVNWGDGSSWNYVVTERTRVEHEYAEEKEYTVKMSGNIKTITSFSTGSYGYYDVNSIHFGGLVNLQTVEMFFMNAPDVINLSRNRELRSVTLMGLSKTKDILLPSTNKITFLDITGSIELPTAVVDRTVSRIYDSVLKSPRSGSINVSIAGYWEGENPIGFVGPPSSWSINKLRTLQNKYHWTVTPEIQ